MFKLKSFYSEMQLPKSSRIFGEKLRSKFLGMNKLLEMLDLRLQTEGKELKEKSLK